MNTSADICCESATLYFNYCDLADYIRWTADTLQLHAQRVDGFLA